MIQTIDEILATHASTRPSKVAFSFARDGGDDARDFASLHRGASAVAACLQDLGAVGKPVLLLFEPGLAFVVGIFGSFQAGAVAVPAFPPEPARLDRTLPRLLSIIGDCAPAAVLTSTAILPVVRAVLEEHLPGARALPIVATDAIPPGDAGRFRPRPPALDDVILLQYTSGSTGDPKGVMLTERNVLSNAEAAAIAFAMSSRTISVSWLPMYHDMGLIGHVVTPLATGFTQHLMSPIDFLRRPLVWLEAVTAKRASMSGAPNFAYNLCTQRVTAEELATLDLSSWEVAYCGAEPVRPATLDAFARTFARAGFSPQALLPCYGLAEATLIVAGEAVGAGMRTRTVDQDELDQDRVRDATAAGRARTLVTVGRAAHETRVLIVDPLTRQPLRSGEVGEIWVHGPGQAAGYWRRPEESATTLSARLAADDDTPFLRTGDLGFLDDGDLFILGRSKDVIIEAGRNIYPQDLEATAERAHAAIRPGCSAAFSVDVDDEERTVIAVEVDGRQLAGPLEAVALAVRTAVAREHDVHLHRVLLLRPRAVEKTSSGKVRRRPCRQAFLAGTLAGETLLEHRPGAGDAKPSPRAPRGELRRHDEVCAWLADAIARRVGIPRSVIDLRAPFNTLGLRSIDAVGLSGELERWIGRPVPPTVFYEHPDVQSLARHLTSAALPAARSAPAPAAAEPIAIVGMACRFPGAPDLDAFWALLRDGVDAIREVPAERWEADRFYDPDATRPGRMNSRWGGFIDGVDRFDAAFFGITAREAASMDPQHRLLLELVWEALEDGGQPVAGLGGSRTGVFVGISTSDYGQAQLGAGRADDPFATMGAAHAMAANRISYVLGARGPSMSIDTACSSSLVAVHGACQSLRAGESRMAVVGGVNLVLTPAVSLSLSKAGFLAPDGRCKAFDARADGYVRAEGAGVVVLKPLPQALADGDRVYAVILGSATNHDGRTNGLTAPSPQAQEALLREAYERAGVDPAAVAYVETHGTGTSLGDPIEARALGNVLGAGRPAERPCPIGSVKTNIGHLEAAAGIAGLIKTALAIHHGHLPPSLHFETPNPHIPFADLSLRVLARPEPWAARRIAGVSAFGFGGTNAHVVLGEAPAPAPRPARAEPAPASQLFLASARSPDALRDYVTALRDTIDATADLERLAAASALRRDHHDVRLAVVAESSAELRDRLDAVVRGEVAPGSSAGSVDGAREPRVVFVFSGQGSQWWGMGRELFDWSPVFRGVVESCDRVVSRLAGWSLTDVLLRPEGRARLQSTAVAQPAIFALQAGLATTLACLGITPGTVVGHSVGEIASAFVAGAFSLEDGAAIAVHRGAVMQAAAGLGKTLAVTGAPEEFPALASGLGTSLAIAAHNSPGMYVVSGSAAAVDAYRGRAEEEGRAAAFVSEDIPFHNAMLAGVAAELAAKLAAVEVGPLTRPMFSTTLAAPVGAPELTPDYWVRNLLQPVRFAAAVGGLVAAGWDTFVEIAPHAVLTRAVLDTARQSGASARTIAVQRRNANGSTSLLEALGQLYTMGHDIRWPVLHAVPAAWSALPCYPWQRRRHWLTFETTETVAADTGRPDAPPVPTVVRVADPLAAAAEYLGTSRLVRGDLLALPAGDRLPRVEEYLLGIVARVLGPHPGELSGADRFNTLGFDSLTVSGMLAQLQGDFAVKIPVRDVVAGMSIGELARLIADGVARPPDAPAPAARPAARSARANGGGPVRIVQSPLLGLFMTENLAPLDAAAIGYFPESFIDATFTRERLLGTWLFGAPGLVNVLSTPVGRIGWILLPRFTSDLYRDEGDTARAVAEAVRLAGRLGARVVSLTGLIPSATRYGQAVAEAVGDRAAPLVTTGHATTTACVVLTLRAALARLARRLDEESLAIVGLGSIGLATLRLVLASEPRPRELVLCDLYAREAQMRRIEAHVRDDLGFAGPVRLALSHGEVPDEIYRTRTIVGASNVGGVLDVARLRPGTLVVDDSAPHCFDPEEARRRFAATGDVLCVAAGTLAAPVPIPELRFVPSGAEDAEDIPGSEVFFRRPDEIVSCILSAALTARTPELGATIGLVDAAHSARHVEMLDRLEFRAAPLHCGRHYFADGAVREFASRFGAGSGA